MFGKKWETKKGTEKTMVIIVVPSTGKILFEEKARKKLTFTR